MPGTDAAQTPVDTDGFRPRGRRGRARSRLLVGVVIGSAAVLAAGTPALVAAGERLSDTQRLVEGAELAQQAVSLAHVLADERATMTTLAAAPAGTVEPPTESDQARADRRAEDLRPLLPAADRELLDEIPAARAAADSGDPVAVHAAYTRIIDGLGATGRAVARARPDRGAAPSSDALPDLARAVEASAATRGLLTAALVAEPGDQERDLLALARRSHAREGAAGGDFAATAGEDGRTAYGSTVTGPGVSAAEERVEELTALPFLSEESRAVAPAELAAELGSRTELQRSLLSNFGAEQTRSLTQLREDDLTAIQVHAAVTGGALLVALAAGIWAARSVTYPLAVVRRGARRVADAPSAEPAVRYAGRNDEFADVVAAVNKLHSRAVELHRYQTGESDDHEALRAELAEVRGEQRELIDKLAAQTRVMHANLTHHARMALDLAGDQLDIIGRLEEHETDPDELATLFALDHLAARMRRHSENLLLLAGVEPDAPFPRPLPLVQVALAAVSESERYELVDVEQPVPAVLVSPVAARDLGHLLAEFLDNASAFSPPGARVLLSAVVREDSSAAPVAPATGDRADGEADDAAGPVLPAQRRGCRSVLIRVQDDGPGVPDERLTALNSQLADPSGPPPGARGEPAAAMGIYTAARLAARHGLRARLRHRAEGGTCAEVELPASLLSDEDSSEAEMFAALAAGDRTAAPAGAGTGAPHVPAPAGGDQDTMVLPTVRGTARLGERPQHDTAGDGGPDVVGAEELRRRLGGFQREARRGQHEGESAGPPAEEEMQS
ncbi:sensor histidine kinase [Streptomyces bohaiensis]|uniref:histidine kinase n=1 Tax=Streptomyces bohaiensis TaxID=1431344 RepID=A0ABX1CB20_9ACTN|nr:nitrate- and nitrite sensing domain-containing protein [Streptomyces bohaiensis]NJQ14815.1 hypothetical protein [Streptomyces bohaiensis]